MAYTRRLDLHVSALNDAEYELYTSSLADISLSDSQNHSADFESISVNVRETRAWLRGRYSHLPAATMDSILRFFSPDLSQADMLSGGQFFAALRLVVHAESGKDIDRALAFVQAHPSSSAISRPGSPSKQPGHQPPPTPSRKSSESTNPFSAPQQHPTFSNNPFSSARSTSAQSHDGGADSAPSKLPPLPPRKIASQTPGLQPPPRHGSFIASSGGNLPPPPPPKPAMLHSQSHGPSPLMKQSLIASKNGKTIKQAEEQLDKERVLRVLKSSESSSSSASSLPFNHARARSISPSKISSSASSSYTSESDHNPPPLPKRGKKPPSPPMSTSSYQQVAMAGMSTDNTPTPSHNPFKSSPFQTVFTRSPSTSPSRKSIDLPPLPSGPPPRHPDQNSNLQSLSYRKPPPPIPPHLSSSNTISGASSGTRRRRPSFSDLQKSIGLSSNDSNNKDFEEVYGSVPKTAAPYVSAFNRAPSDVTPTRNREGDYFGDNSPGGRMYRSKSLHHPSPPSYVNRFATTEVGEQDRSPFSPIDGDTHFSPPGQAPVPRRKRPESVQVSGTKAIVLDANDWRGNLGLGSTSSNLSRHASLSTPSPPTASFRKPTATSSATSSDSPLRSLAASLQPQLSSMQQQLQPHLDRARFKAEAGLSRRGFVREPASIIRRREDQEGLMRDGSWEEPIDSDDSLDEEVPRNSRMGAANWGEIGREKRVGIEKDHLKWPVAEGEGWKAF